MTNSQLVPLVTNSEALGGYVTGIWAEGPTIHATLKAADAGKGTVTVLVGAGRGSEGEEKTFTLAKKGKVFHNGKEIKLADLKVKDDTVVSVKLSLDQKTATSVTVADEARKRRE